MMHTPTIFGSLNNYQKGHVELISGDVRHYVFSNIFEVAGKATPYERIVVARNLDYVQEVMRAEGISPWFACSHDEIAICMDGEIRVDFIKLNKAPSPDINGAILAGPNPEGAKMGYVRLRAGHQALLPAGCAYCFAAARVGVILQQTMRGELSVEKWREICLTA